MAYSKQELEQQALEVIDKENIIFIEDLVTFMPCSAKTFYNHELHKLQTLKDKINNNKIKDKATLRAKWFKSDNATLQVALYKLLANEEELDRLNNREKVVEENTPKLEITLNGINEKTK